MSSNFEPLIPATPAFNESGTPMSARYGDVYHPQAGALEQARHVFLRGNQLPHRWQGKDSFTVCETGFGLGHNFLALWQAWREDPQRCARLHVLSFEAHPFARHDLALLLSPLTGASRRLADALLAAWPPLLPGIHRLEFEEGAVTLTLAFGSVVQMARQVSANVDAFFLDGFAPQRNPEMWSRSLFGQLARIASAGATAASWCCAGEVRRNLRDAGFLVSKAPGFGSKWAMMVAALRPGMGHVGTVRSGSDRVLVVGGGLAGAGIAQSLALRGHDVIVLDPVFARGTGASHDGHLAAAMTPVISRDDDVRSRLSRAGAQRALQRWMGLPEPGRPVRCGTIELLPDPMHACERRKTLDRLKFPESWVGWRDAGQVSELAGFDLPSDGIWFADGLLVQPQPLLHALFDDGRIRCHAGRVEQLAFSPDGLWRAQDAGGKELASASTVVLANSDQAGKILRTVAGNPRLTKLESMSRLRGQVSYFPQHGARATRLILAGDGYWLPAVEGYHVGGSTYATDILKAEVSMQGHQEVTQKLVRLLGISADMQGLLPGAEAGWAGFRATPSDRLPLIGPVGSLPGLWLACGFGSRGLTWSALAGDIIAATLNQEPAPLERELLRSIAPR